MHLAAAPGVAQLVGRDGDGRACHGRLRLQEAVAADLFVGRQVAQGDVVDQHQQLDVQVRLVRRRPHGHVVRDGGDAGLVIDAPLLVRQDNIVVGAEEIVAGALVHPWCVAQIGGRLDARRLAGTLDLLQVGGAGHAQAAARHGRHAVGGVELEGAMAAAAIDGLVQQVQLGRDETPVVERLLQGRGDAVGQMGRFQVARDDSQLAVARAVLQCS